MVLNEVITEQIREIARQPQNRSHAVVVLPLFDATLTEIKSERGEIIRSSHLGNDYPSNQAFVNAVESASFELYDRTTGVDRNYFPWQIVKQGQHFDITQKVPEDLLTPFFRPNREFFSQLEELPLELQDTKTPAHLHYLSQKLLHPATRTFSQWILQNRDTVMAITDTIGRFNYQIFNRQINQDGRVLKPDKNEYRESGQKIIETAKSLVETVMDGDPTPKGRLLLHINELNLYLDAAIGSLSPKSQTVVDDELWGVVLHGAGPDMIRYATGLWRQLGELHTIVTTHLPELGIPRKIVFGLIPTAELKLALPKSCNGAIDQLADLLLAKESIQKRSALDYQIRQDTRAAIANPYFDKIMFGQPFSRHGSQYDVLTEGGMRFPDKLHHLTFRQIKQINESLGQIRRTI